MKYILMLSGTKAEFDWYAKWSPQDYEAQAAFMHAFHEELKDSGVFVAAEGLAFPDQARVVRAGRDGAPIVTNGIVRGVKDGAPFVTDGVFPESKEFLAGYTSNFRLPMSGRSACAQFYTSCTSSSMRAIRAAPDLICVETICRMRRCD